MTVNAEDLQIISQGPLSGLLPESPRRVEIDGVRITNYSAVPFGQAYNWLPRGIVADEIVLFPDLCPSDSAPLPTGCAVKTMDPDWRRLAVSDCGCGMQLIRSGRPFEQFDTEKFDALGRHLKTHKNSLGDLGGGNHFLDALVSHNDDMVYFLIHTGSRNESGLVDRLVDKPELFDREFERIVTWARNNRDAVAATVRSWFGKCELVLDLAHNTVEKTSDGGAIIRKGVVAVKEGEITVLPSSMTGDVVLLRASVDVGEALNSLSHGTGRLISRSEARTLADQENATEIRRRIHIPDYISDRSLTTEGPHCYRALDDCLALLGGLAHEQERFSVIAYLGHL